MDVNDDPQSPDAGSARPGRDFDLTPRTAPGPSGGSTARSPGGRRNLGIAVLVLVLAAAGFVLFQGLNDAATFFYNVDEAVDQRATLEGERFRMQGNVVEGSVEESADGVAFTIAFNGAEVPVQHTGTPPELFGTDIPVVVEGEFEDEVFASDEILIRHDDSYEEDNPDRIADAERDAQSTP